MGGTQTHQHDERPLSDIEIRVKALESLLLEKGYIHPETLERLIQTYNMRLDRITEPKL